jgi:hypothetical protein
MKTSPPEGTFCNAPPKTGTAVVRDTIQINIIVQRQRSISLLSRPVYTAPHVSDPAGGYSGSQSVIFRQDMAAAGGFVSGSGLSRSPARGFPPLVYHYRVGDKTLPDYSGTASPPANRVFILSFQTETE